MPGYAYRAQGTARRYEDLYEFTTDIGPTTAPTQTVEEPIDYTGAYVSPDQSTTTWVQEVDPYLVEVRSIGDQVWIRERGSLRWKALGEQPDAGSMANSLLTKLERMTSWTAADGTTGSCVITGTASVSNSNGLATTTTTVTTPPGSEMPTRIDIDEQIDAEQPDWGAESRRLVSYQVNTADEVTIEEPSVDTGPATAEEVRYAVEQRNCQTPPCEISDFEIEFEAHEDGVDLFGYRVGDKHAQVWFDDGLPSEMYGGSCEKSAFSWAEHRIDVGPDDDPKEPVLWIGGPMTLADTAELRIRYSDGVEDSYEISAPAYLVRGRASDTTELRIEKVSLVGPDGQELVSEDVPGMPPPIDGC